MAKQNFIDASWNAAIEEVNRSEYVYGLCGVNLEVCRDSIERKAICDSGIEASERVLKKALNGAGRYFFVEELERLIAITPKINEFRQKKGVNGKINWEGPIKEIFESLGWSYGSSEF